MAVHKRKLRNGRVSWFYRFDAPGSTRENRIQISAYGFPNKKVAQDAESERRLEVQRASTAAPDEPPPPALMLKDLFGEFFKEYAVPNLAPKTIERYTETLSYLSPALLETPVDQITPRLLTREWNRLRESGGHHRKTRVVRPLSAKTVRNIAGVVSSAFAWGIKWQIAPTNPVANSALPAIPRKEGIAFSIDEQELLLKAAQTHWALPITLELAAATGARRGEILALRWSDIVGSRLRIARALSQTKAGLTFKRPKSEKSRTVTLPASAVALLQAHRARQEICRRQFGPHYRADLDLVVANPDGTPLKPDSISAAASALCRRLKLPKGASFHTLRHTHGSHLLAAGLELPAVSARLGHSNPNVTATVYAHVLAGRDDQAAEMWEEFQKRKSKVEPPEPKI
jgi:integrase